MGLYRYWARVAGYLVILVKGAALERLLNLASANGIYLWDIRRYRPDLMIASVGIRGYRALRPYLHRTHCQARIQRRRGLPFLRHRLCRRAGFLVGFLLFVVTLAVLTSFIWRVELVGLKKIPAPVLRANLRRLGLYRGVWRGRLEKDKIQRDLEIMTPQASWIGIEIRGMVAVVRVVERVTPPPAPKAGDLVAARDGLVTKVVVYQGTPVVAEGETVRRGQLLVSGTEIGLSGQGGLAARQVPARAEIEARIWEEAEAVVPLVTWEMIATKRRTTIVRLRLGRWEWSIGPRRIPFAWYKQVRSRHKLGQGRNTLPLVELVIDRYHEVRPFLRRQSVPEAAAAGTRESRDVLAGRLPVVSGHAVTRRTIVQTEPGWVTVTSGAETVQEIALPAQRGTENGLDRRSTAPVHGGE